MSEELQTTESLDTVFQEEIVNDDTGGTGETGSELAADSGETHEQINQESVNQAINKQHAKYKDEERKRKAAEAQNQELLERLEKLEMAEEPIVPPIPDVYDDDFEAKVKERDKALLAKAGYDAEQKAKADAVASKQAEAQQAKQAEMQKHIDGYNQRSSDLGFDPNEVNKAGQKLVDAGITAELATFILQDSDGPLITQYLSANPMELTDLIEMSPMMAGVTINSIVRDKAQAFKLKKTNAPDPVERISGMGPGEQVSPLIKNGKFE